MTVHSGYSNKLFSLEDAQSCVGKGWAGLVERGWQALDAENATLMQVKEKFGELRMYAGGCSGITLDLLEDLCRESIKICEECGAPGKLRSGGWIRTLCDEHAEDHKG